MAGHDPLRPTVLLPHNKVRLALHQLRAEGAGGPPLLLLHGLGEQTGDAVPVAVTGWPGPIWGLDFTGHGASSVPVGGGYTAEVLMADADIALGHLGGAALYGRGLGGYVAVLLAGARPAAVRGVIVADGPGLAGGGDRPETVVIATVDEGEVENEVEVEVGGEAAADPYALSELSRDVRPPDHVRDYLRGTEIPPITACSEERPPWLAALVDDGTVEAMSLPAALARLSST